MLDENRRTATQIETGLWHQQMWRKSKVERRAACGAWAKAGDYIASPAARPPLRQVGALGAQR
jgi:hypothetical protein